MSSSHSKTPPTGKALAALAFTTLGVVYGDIGTSPLYAIKECFSGHHSIAPTPENVIGVLSLIFWSINFIVSFKYITFVLRADNRGEGGTFALLAQVRPLTRPGSGRVVLIALGLFGAALLYGDGVITPAISVLGAIEGVTVAAPAVGDWVWPIAAVVLTAVFAVQKHGTAKIGGMFGPVMAVWFASIAVLGVRGIAMAPEVLKAVNPWYAVDFFIRDGIQAFLILGSVVLVVTGAEALYADMGHFGRRPIRVSWFAVVLPCLLINYFGQAGLLLISPEARLNPFFSLAPSWALYPMVGIATAAAIVASQALISGAFSLTRQAVQLGYIPRVTIVHTSSTQIGQIYIPEVNWALWLGCLFLVVVYRSSSNLAAAYGIAVTGTMLTTTLLFHTVLCDQWKWPRWRARALTSLFFAVDAAFFSANLIKIQEGGWFPIIVGIGVYVLMATWNRGRARLQAIVQENTLEMDLFLSDVARRKPPRVPGTAVFLTSNISGAPPVLLHHLKHNKVLHEKVILMSVVTEEIPALDEDEDERVECQELGEGFFKVIAHYGFMESPDIPSALAKLGSGSGDGRPVAIKPLETSFFLGRETLIATRNLPAHVPVPDAIGRMSMWRKRLFILMTRNARSATAFFGLPPNRVVELGAQIQF
ncbi:MAG TPA: potassium transporter Kup [Gemmatimonadales bacterium]|nr:potassium transporter Kup [Gemmatimonadales bacterium]